MSDWFYGIARSSVCIGKCVLVATQRNSAAIQNLFLLVSYLTVFCGPLLFGVFFPFLSCLFTVPTITFTDGARRASDRDRKISQCRYHAPVKESKEKKKNVCLIALPLLQKCTFSTVARLAKKSGFQKTKLPATRQASRFLRVLRCSDLNPTLSPCKV